MLRKKQFFKIAKYNSIYKNIIQFEIVTKCHKKTLDLVLYSLKINRLAAINLSNLINVGKVDALFLFLAIK